MCVIVYDCIRVCVYDCIRVCVYDCIRVCVYDCIRLCVYDCICVCVYGCIRVFVYDCIRVCVYVCRDNEGKFEFTIIWPRRKGANYNIWRQSTNPVIDTKYRVQGYEAVDVKFTGLYWGGLESGFLHSTDPSALLDGSSDGSELSGKVHVARAWARA